MTGASSTAPIELPQTGQKARDDRSEDRQTAGAPPGPVHSTAARGTSTQATVRLPVCRWHIRHEQVCGISTAPLTLNLMLPQRQPPSRTFPPTTTPQKSMARPFFSQSP